MRIATTLALTATLACSWAAPARADEPDDDTEVECKPACRSGYVCVDGECKSACNPPCASNERCSAKAACVRLSTERAAGRSDDRDETPAPSKPPAGKTATKYRPSVGRVYVGPMMLALAYRGVLLADPGASLALDFHVGDDRVFFLGFRGGVVGDSSGVIASFDLDLGFRPRLYEGEDAGVSLVLGGGIGASVIALANSSSLALFHLPARFGPCFDFGAFTFELLGGPALFAAKGAFGAFEGVAELGARF